MQISRYDDAEAFSRRAEPYLLAHEAEHNLSLGILSNLRHQPLLFATPPYLALVEEGDETQLVAIRTPPFNLVLSRVSDGRRTAEALAVLAGDLATAQPDLGGVLGPNALSRAFAEQWQALTGRAWRPSTRERIYQLTVVRPVAGVSGRLRRATNADRKLLQEWIAAFHAEALQDGEPIDPVQWVERALGSEMRMVCLWEDVGPVSLACAGNPTPNGIRIGPVYTPPEHRGRGYASGCVAALSQQMLDAGRRFCFLFTDLANPTSNHIYQAIGYIPVSDAAVYRFG